MLVIARFFKNEESQEYYFNAKFTELLKIAKVNVDKAGRITLMNELTKNGYISPTYTGAFKLNYIAEEGLAGVVVKDIEQIALFFPVRCSECKQVCENISRWHGLCEECHKANRQKQWAASKRNKRKIEEYG